MYEMKRLYSVEMAGIIIKNAEQAKNLEEGSCDLHLPGETEKKQ
jgi:hypothetical protein